MRFFHFFAGLAAILLCAPAASLSAQTFALPSVRFTGATAYAQTELLAFTGLRPGDSVTRQQLDDAAQRLNDTGLFADVSFAGDDKGVVYTLKPAPAGAVLPVRFGNFVWWQDAEIDRALQKSVPLYRGTAVPIVGALRQTICDSLTGMLASKGVQAATVVSLRSASRVGGPLDAIAFTIDSPAVLIHSLTLLQASPAMQPKLNRVIKDMVGQQWDKVATYPSIASRVGDVYRNDGYLDIAVPTQDRSAPIVSASSIDLDLTATLSEGAQYHVSQLAWPGSEVLSTEDFNKHATLKPGDPDSPVPLHDSLGTLTNAYAARGYMDAKIVAPPAIDHVAHQVAYTIRVLPGPQYRFQSVHWAGASDAQGKEFDAAWRMKPGDLYDGSYIGRFLAQNPAFRKQGYNAAIRVKSDPAALTVDLTVTFVKAAAPARN